MDWGWPNRVRSTGGVNDARTAAFMRPPVRTWMVIWLGGTESNLERCVVKSKSILVEGCFRRGSFQVICGSIPQRNSIIWCIFKLPRKVVICQVPPPNQVPSPMLPERIHSSLHLNSQKKGYYNLKWRRCSQVLNFSIDLSFHCIGWTIGLILALKISKRVQKSDHGRVKNSLDLRWSEYRIARYVGTEL